MQNISFIGIPDEYKSTINETQHKLIQDLYSKFNFLYLKFDQINIENENDEDYYEKYQNSAENFLFDYLKNFRLMTYYFSNSENSKISQLQSVQQKSLNHLDVIFCFEGESIIIEQISSNLLKKIISKLQKEKIAIINAKDDTNLDIQNFYQQIHQYIKNNKFVTKTIKAVIGYLIRRYSYPSYYFKDPSFFNFESITQNFERQSKSQIFDLLKSISIKQIFEITISKIIYEIEKHDNSIKSNNYQEFKMQDFIVLEQLYINDNSSILKVIHINSLFVFVVKKIIKSIPTNNQHEINFCQNFSHRCFVPFYGFLKEKNEITGFVYEFMSNNSIDKYFLRHQKENDQILSLTIINRLYQGIEYLHSNSLIHRDLKPTNILLNHDYIPYISDFETIKSTENKLLEFTYDFGSYLYASPEQNEGSNISFPTDVYSFGLIIYFLITKKHYNVEKKQLNPKFSKQLFDLIENCIRNNQLERPDLNEIKNILINEFNSFDYFENYLFDELTNIDPSQIIQYIYESIIIQINQKEKLRKFLLNVFNFQEIFQAKIEKNYSSVLVRLGNYYYQGYKVEKNYPKAKKYYEMGAKMNNSDAIMNLGLLYFNGRGVGKDQAKAKEYIEQSAQQNNASAYVFLAELYKRGLTVERNKLKAKELYEKAAKQNNLKALLSLASFYYNGDGGKRDFVKAKEYYELAANQGDKDAIYNLGVFYLNGFGTKQDYAKAKEYLELSAKLGNEQSHLILGLIYYKGFGIQQDYEKALYHLGISAKYNNVKALQFLGIIYLTGNGAKQDYKKAKEYFEICSKQKNIHALYYLGVIYLNGLGVGKDYTKAYQYFKTSANFNNHNALLNLGYLYLNGFGVEKNYTKAREFFELSANYGNSEAYVNLGIMYKFGFGVKQDFLISKNYFESSAKLNNANAFYYLGTFYEEGCGVKKDYLKAKKYYELGSLKNNSNSLFKLGNLYFEGYGIEQDYLKAKHYFELSSQTNNEKATFYLGLIYVNGCGVDKDYLKGLKYFELSAKYNNSSAMVNLGIIFNFGLGVPKDYIKAKMYFEKSAFLNNHYGLLYLGDMHFNGLGVQKDYLKAKKYYELSATMNNSCACYNLGCIYYFGYGVKRDYKKAKNYYEKSANSNNSNAYINLGILYENGEGVQKDYLKAIKYYEYAAQLNNFVAFYLLGDRYSNGYILDADIPKAIEYFLQCIQKAKNKDVLYLTYNNYYYRSFNDLGLIYIIMLQNVEKATDYIKEAAFAEYPFGQNNYGILNQFYLNNIDNAEYFFERSAKHHFVLAEYNLGYLKELNGKIEESIKYYKKASEDENYPLIFRNNINNDERLRISKEFILCFINLKLVDYYLNKSNMNEAKKYFIKVFSKLFIKKDNIIYKFRFEYHRQATNETPFSYLRLFILNFPTFNLKNQPNLNLNPDLFINSNHINNNKNEDIKHKLLDIGEKQNKRNSCFEKTDEIENLIIFEDTGDLFNFITDNVAIILKFKEEIKKIIKIIKSIIYTPPYIFLFGRVFLEKIKNSPNKNVNPYIKDINEAFYEGFEYI